MILIRSSSYTEYVLSFPAYVRAEGNNDLREEETGLERVETETVHFHCGYHLIIPCHRTHVKRVILFISGLVAGIQWLAVFISSNARKFSPIPIREYVLVLVARLHHNHHSVSTELSEKVLIIGKFVADGSL